MVVSIVALVVAMGGTGYAAVTLPRNSVGSRQIKPGGVKPSDIASNAVTSTKVANGSLLSADFKSGQLNAGATGSEGDKGDTGEDGAAGDTGEEGAAGDQGVQGETGSAGPTASSSAENATCCPISSLSGTAYVGLDSPNSTTSGQLTTTFDARIFAQAELDLRQPVGGSTAAQARCRLEISDGTGPTNGLTSMSVTVYANVPGISGFGVAVPVTGSAVKTAGTYNVVASCDQNAGGAYEFQGGSLIVWAIGT
jgi:hypothetical protein